MQRNRFYNGIVSEIKFYSFMNGEYMDVNILH